MMMVKKKPKLKQQLFADVEVQITNPIVMVVIIKITLLDKKRPFENKEPENL
jgi:hypothetical protein